MNMGDYEELYFDEYYRVLVLSERDNYIVSVDVYVKKDKFEYSSETCTDNVCLLVREIKETHCKVPGVTRVLVIAVKVRENPVEVVSVKWILDHKPSREEVEELYRESWRLATSL